LGKCRRAGYLLLSPYFRRANGILTIPGTQATPEMHATNPAPQATNWFPQVQEFFRKLRQSHGTIGLELGSDRM
jgi:hypothetical protein